MKLVYTSDKDRQTMNVLRKAHPEVTPCIQVALGQAQKHDLGWGWVNFTVNSTRWMWRVVLNKDTNEANVSLVASQKEPLL